MRHFWLSSQKIIDSILVPKFYDPRIEKALQRLEVSHDIATVSEFFAADEVSISTGDEIGSSAYGTGSIPFVRTSDISNWEIRSNPKQGVDLRTYRQFSEKQDVQTGDILLVRDGTYLIGTNCFVTAADRQLLFQSHILKFRWSSKRYSPELLFLALNSPIVQKQFRSVQFTADIIDTMGSRYLHVKLPFPKSAIIQKQLTDACSLALTARVKGKCLIKQLPTLLERVLKTESFDVVEGFLQCDLSELSELLTQDTISAEFGGFEHTWIKRSELVDDIFLPKYYDPEIDDELSVLADTCDVTSIGGLVAEGVLALATGDEPGKMAYGTGEIPFVRTSDFANLEIKHDPKQGLSEELYEYYRLKQDVQVDDILLVRDGTYLVGTSAMVSSRDCKMVYCGGLYKIRVLENSKLDSYLLLALLNTYIVKRQIRARQFTRDVIDTLGKRLYEVRLPIPKSPHVRQRLSQLMYDVVHGRLSARDEIRRLALAMEASDARHAS